MGSIPQQQQPLYSTSTQDQDPHKIRIHTLGPFLCFVFLVKLLLLLLYTGDEEEPGGFSQGIGVEISKPRLA